MIAARQVLIAFIAAFTLILVGCASIGAPLPPSLELIKPTTDLHAVRKGDRVYLSWTVPTLTMEHQSVRHRGPTLICRSLQVAMAECGSPAGDIPADALPEPNGNVPRPQANYVDQIPRDLIDYGLHAPQDPPVRSATYAVEALNGSSRAAGLSNQVHVSLAPTFPPPKDFHGELTPNGVQLSWTGELLSLPLSRVFSVYRVYRRAEGTNERAVIGTVPRGSSAQLSLVDQTIAWEKHYEYWINVVTDVQNDPYPCTSPENTPSTCNDQLEIEGDDSPILKVFTHDIYPPAVPTGVQAVFSGPGQQPFIDVNWAPDTEPDLAGYNVYRHEAGAPATRVNAELVKTPSYRDSSVDSGKTYFYSVSAVDLRGNESARSEEASEQVP